MSGRALDTNAVIALQKSEPGLLNLLASNVEIFIPSIVVGELYYGSYNSGRINENLNVLKEFVEDNTILNCDAVTGSIFGQLRHQLKTKGQPIPENDIWIAAIALQHELILVTRDAHFNAIADLPVEIW